MEDIIIMLATQADLKKLQKIARQTFYEAFADENTEEDMQKYLDESFNDEKLLEELINPDSVFYLASLNNNVIGYIKLNYGQAQTDLKDNKSLEIERIYVLREYHGKKVAQILYNKALKIAQQANMDYLWLGVWEKNPRAINFYKKNGFIEFDKHLFVLGNDVQTDIMMKLLLS